MSLNLAPMVDVIMCLLIFFMLAAKLVERENSAIDLPAAVSAKEADKQALGERVVVNIRAAGPGEAQAGGGPVVYLIDEQPVTLDEVGSRLMREGRESPSVNCVIRAARGVGYQHVEAVLLACSRAQIVNVTFSALRGEAGR